MFLGLIALIVVGYFIYQVATGRETGVQEWLGNNRQMVKVPEEIINERYARGEITREEFQQLRTDLNR